MPAEKKAKKKRGRPREYADDDPLHEYWRTQKELEKAFNERFGLVTDTVLISEKRPKHTRDFSKKNS